jgi:diketogulonate reductase-like aldo/keto reductase
MPNEYPYSPSLPPSLHFLGMDKGEGVGVLNNPTIKALAEKHGRSPAQICLRWAVQRG